MHIAFTYLLLTLIYLIFRKELECKILVKIPENIPENKGDTAREKLKVSNVSTLVKINPKHAKVFITGN